MGRMKKADKHAMIRSDVAAAEAGIMEAIRLAARVGPQLVVGGYSFFLMRKPYRVADVTINAFGALKQRGAIPLNNVPGGFGPVSMSVELAARVAALVSPVVAILGIMYQGLLAGVGTALVTPILTLMAPYLEAEPVIMENPFNVSDPPAGYVHMGWRLVVPDALFLASIQPLILGVLTSQGVERPATLTGAIG